jgi:hypothetical protein
MLLQMATNVLDSSETLMNCEEKARLLVAYQTRAHLYSLSVDQIQQARSTTKREVYRELIRLSDNARIQCERARIELESHLSEHGC